MISDFVGADSISARKKYIEIFFAGGNRFRPYGKQNSFIHTNYNLYYSINLGGNKKCHII